MRRAQGSFDYLLVLGGVLAVVVLVGMLLQGLEKKTSASTERGVTAFFNITGERILAMQREGQATPAPEPEGTPTPEATPGPEPGTGYQLSGFVLDQDGGAANAIVSVTLPDGSPVFESVTGPDGSYEFLDVPDGGYNVSVVDNSGAYPENPPSAWSAVAVAGADAELDFTLVYPGAPPEPGFAYALSGYVADQDGYGVYAYVRASFPNGTAAYEYATDYDGYYLFEDVPAGTYNLSAEDNSPVPLGEGAIPPSNWSAVDLTGNTEVNLTLTYSAPAEPGAAYGLSGYVFDQDGYGVYALVNLSYLNGTKLAEYATDGDGFYTFFENPYGRYNVSAEDNSPLPLGEGIVIHPVNFTIITLAADSELNFTLDYNPNFTVSGRITFPNGTAMANEYASLSDVPFWIRISKFNLTDSEGGYSFTMPAGEYIVGVVDGSLNNGTVSWGVAEAITLDRDISLNLTLVPTYYWTLSGNVTYDNGTRLADGMVEAKTLVRPFSYNYAYTDEKGNYSIAGLATNNYSVNVYNSTGQVIGGLAWAYVDQPTTANITIPSGQPALECQLSCQAVQVSGTCLQSSPCKNQTQRYLPSPNVTFSVNSSNCAGYIKVDTAPSPLTDPLPPNTWTTAVDLLPNQESNATWNFCNSVTCWGVGAEQQLYWRIVDEVTGKKVNCTGLTYSVPAPTPSPTPTPTPTPSPDLRSQNISILGGTSFTATICNNGTANVSKPFNSKLFNSDSPSYSFTYNTGTWQVEPGFCFTFASACTNFGVPDCSSSVNLTASADSDGIVAESDETNNNLSQRFIAPPNPGADFETFDLASLDSRARGYRGGVFDNRYVYFVPYINSGSAHGLAARYDSQANFSSPAAYQVYNLTSVNASWKGFSHGVFDGRYAYYVPNTLGSASSGVALRYDSQASFASPSSYSSFNLTTLNSGLRGFSGAVFDGRYAYFIPNFFGGSTYSGLAARYDTQASFTGPSSYSSFNLTTVNPSAKGFTGGVFDGRYVYFIPMNNGQYSGLAARYDTQASFTSPSSYSFFDLASIDTGLKGFSGGIFDGRYVYFVPNFNGLARSGKVARYDTQASFTSPSSYSYFDIAAFAPALKGFVTGVFDGRYAYFAPYTNGSNYFGSAVRYDTQASFTSRSSYSYFDLSSMNAGLKGFTGSLFDGKYVYFTPNTNDAGYSGLATRYNASGAIPWNPV